MYWTQGSGSCKGKDANRLISHIDEASSCQVVPRSALQCPTLLFHSLLKAKVSDCDQTEEREHIHLLSIFDSHWLQHSGLLASSLLEKIHRGVNGGL